MPRLVFLNAAIADLQSIQKYLTRRSKSRVTGETFALAIVDQCRKLASLPGTIGRPRPELGSDLRSFPFKGHLIFFRYREDAFEVVNIISARRNLPPLFPKTD